MNGRSLLSIFPTQNDLLGAAPEDLGAVIVEIAPSVMQNGMFNLHSLLYPLYEPVRPSYAGSRLQTSLALAEALSWLIAQGLVVLDPEQPAHWYRLTRRAQTLRTRPDVEAFVRGRVLPDDLVPELFARKVIPLFRRGDYDVAVFQAFKELEVVVRKTANSKGAGYPDNFVGVDLMRRAFHPEHGPLINLTLVPSEREAEMHLFSGAIGHAKNPPGHRDFEITAVEGAKLIVFASYLLSIVQQRAVRSD